MGVGILVVLLGLLDGLLVAGCWDVSVVRMGDLGL